MQTLARKLIPLHVVVMALGVSCMSPSPRLTPEALAADSVIRRDRYGVPHITADSHEAAAFAFGYAQAEDHFLVIARRLIAARGEEARHFGVSGTENDLAMARLDNLSESHRGLERVGPVFRRMLAASASGINQYAREPRASAPSWVPTFDAVDVMASLRASAVDSIGSPAHSTAPRQIRAPHDR